MGKPNVQIQVAGKEKVFENYTRGKAIKQFCRDCMGGVVAEVRNCTAERCPLFVFRPYSKNIPE